jgi:O-antigen ligase
MMIYQRRAILPLVALLIVGVIGFTAAAALSERFARALDFSQGTNFYRVRVWQSALNIIADRPLTGLGLDQFLYAFRGTYIYPDAWQEPNLSHPHNIVLDFWVRLGIGGVLWLIAVQTVFWRGVFQQLRGIQIQTQDPMRFALLVGTAGSMVNLLAHGLVDNSVFVIDLGFVFMLLLALQNPVLRGTKQD